MQIMRMQNEIDLPAVRAKLGLTQADLAAKAGVNVTTVWRWENDGVPTRGPARAFLNQLAAEAEKARAA